MDLILKLVQTWGSFGCCEEGRSICLQCKNKLRIRVFNGPEEPEETGYYIEKDGKSLPEHTKPMSQIPGCIVIDHFCTKKCARTWVKNSQYKNAEVV